jgi:hypothetical protein
MKIRQTEFHFLRDNANYLRAPSLPCLSLGSELPSLFWAIAATTRVAFDLFADGAWIKIRPSVRLAGWFRLPLEGDRGQ